MQTIFKLLITEGVFLIIGMVVCRIFLDEKGFKWLGIVAGFLMLVCALALIVTGMWYLWTL